MKKKLKLLYFIILTIFFSFLIFYIKNYFFGGFKKQVNNQIENKYIEPTIENNYNSLSDPILNNIVKEKFINDYLSAKNIKFDYIPIEFENDCKIYTQNLNLFLENKSIKNKINEIGIEMYKNILDVRGKMKDRSVKLFGVLKMEDSEFLSVFIHEFGHYVDLYYLEKKVLKDISDYFYNISWESTKTIKAGQNIKDFVSGYAMTNKYEDFAETFTYYILHNSDFLIKAKKSDILQKKYDFIKNNVFINNEFISLETLEEKNIKDYYRDITKIGYNLENFLQYLTN